MSGYQVSHDQKRARKRTARAGFTAAVHPGSLVGTEPHSFALRNPTETTVRSCDSFQTSTAATRKINHS